MKDDIKVMIYFTIFVVFMVFAYLGYNTLSKGEVNNKRKN